MLCCCLLPISVTVGKYKLVDAPLGKSIRQPSFVSGVRDLNSVKTL